MQGILIIFGVALAGILAGWFIPGLQKAEKAIGAAQNICLFVLIALMGLKIGLDDEVFHYIPSIGLMALAFAAATILGSVLLTFLLTKGIKKRTAGEGAGQAQQQPPSLGMTAAILVCVVIGVAAGRLVPAFQAMLPHVDSIVMIGVYAIVFVAGIDFGRSRSVFSVLKQNGWSLFLVPLGIAAGSILFGALAGLLMGLSPLEGGAVGSGFGWYSYSGVVLSTVDTQLGAVAFLSNILREILALICTPLVARKLGPYTAAAPGGATTMDTTLPVVVRSAGAQYGVVAFVSGAVLTLCVPLAVNTFMALMGG